MGFGRSDKPCERFDFWLKEPGLCGRCAWPENEHKEIVMKPYQARVITELSELNKKRDKLTEFIKSDTFRSISEDEQGLLKRQDEAMFRYAAVLSERIVKF